MGVHRIPGAVDVEGELAAEEAIGIENACQQHDIGQRRIGAATTETGRAWQSPHAFGPDPDGTVRYAEDRTATGGHAGHIGQRKGDGRTFYIAKAMFGHPAVFEQCKVGGGAADVDRDNAVKAIMISQNRGPHGPAARTGRIGVERDRPRNTRRPAIIAKYQQRIARAMLAQPIFGVVQELLHRRMEEGVDQSRP